METRVKQKYIPTIGIETHIQLKTKTKLFAAVLNDARIAPPNSLISHICVGMPGALPVLNREAINMCIKVAFALGTDPQVFSKFERKHYFYPDLPKGYQITQYEDPIIKGGSVKISVNDKEKNIRIERANLEEDAGKNTHPAGADYTLVDLNRAGTPLLEIVSEPDIHSPAEAKAFARELYLLMKYAGVTDGDLYHGHMRFDLNISVSNGSKLGTRTEIKNLNSFRSVEAAANFEINRQIGILKYGDKIIQETRGWDETKQKTFSQRTKEEAEDYRYMPEPDVPPVVLSQELVASIKETMTELPDDIRLKLEAIKVDKKVVEDILDRPSLIKPVLEALRTGSAEDARRVAFWMLQAQPADELVAGGVEPSVDTERLIALSKMIDSGQLSSTTGKEVFNNMLSSNEQPEDIAKKLNLVQISDDAELEDIVAEVINQNQKVAKDIKSGNKRAIGFLIGQVMQKTKGQANPQTTQKLIKKQLGV